MNNHDQTPPSAAAASISDEHLGAVEGDRADDDPQQGNPNAPALDDEGLPNDEWRSPRTCSARTSTKRKGEAA